MKSIVETISAAHFMANEEQVGRLVYAVQEGQAADVTYLRVVLAHTRMQLSRARRGSNAEAVLDKVHDRFYPVVLRSLGSEETPTKELNRKATFARSATSTIRFFIRHGGDIRALDLATVTKTGLRKAVQPAEKEVEGETKAERALRKLEERYLKSLQRVTSTGDPEQARDRIEAAIGRLEDLLAGLGEAETEEVAEEVPAPLITKHTLERRRVASGARRAAM